MNKPTYDEMGSEIKRLLGDGLIEVERLRQVVAELFQQIKTAEAERDELREWFGRNRIALLNTPILRGQAEMKILGELLAATEEGGDETD